MVPSYWLKINSCQWSRLSAIIQIIGAAVFSETATPRHKSKGTLSACISVKILISTFSLSAVTHSFSWVSTQFRGSQSGKAYYG